jgi:hypothetical protein
MKVEELGSPVPLTSRVLILRGGVLNNRAMRDLLEI